MVDGFPSDTVGGAGARRAADHAVRDGTHRGEGDGAGRSTLGLRRAASIDSAGAPPGSGSIGRAAGAAAPAFSTLFAPHGHTSAPSMAALPPLPPLAGEGGVRSTAPDPASWPADREHQEALVEQSLVGHIFSGIEIGRLAGSGAAQRHELSLCGPTASAATAGAPALRVGASAIGAHSRAIAHDASSGMRAPRAEVGAAGYRAARAPLPDGLRASPAPFRAPAPSGSVSPTSGDVLPPRQPPAPDDPLSSTGATSIGEAVTRLRQALRSVATVDADAAVPRHSIAPEPSAGMALDVANRFGMLSRGIAGADPRALGGAATPSIASAAGAPIAVMAPVALGDRWTAVAPQRVGLDEPPVRASTDAAARLGHGGDRASPGREDRFAEAPLSFGVEPLRERGAAAAQTAQHLPVHARAEVQAVMPSNGAATATATLADASRSSGAPAYAAPLPLDVAGDSQELGMALGHRLIALARNGEQRARIALHPAELGAIEIRINLRDEAASIAITAQQPQARELIETNIPRLRELFADQGLSLGDVDVSGHRDGAAARADEPLASGAIRATSAVAQPALDDDEPELHLPTRGSGARLLDVLA